MLGLFELTATRTHGLLNTLEGAGIGLRALATSRETLRVSGTSVGIDVFQTLDVCGNRTLQLTFNGEAFDLLANRVFLFSGDFSRLRVLLDAKLSQNFFGTRSADAMNGGQTKLQVLVIRNGNTRDTHILLILGAACGAALTC